VHGEGRHNHNNKKKIAVRKFWRNKVQIEATTIPDLLVNKRCKEEE